MTDDKLKYILAKGKEIRGKYRKGEPIADCQVDTWLNIEVVDGKVYFYPDSTSMIVAGIFALIKEINDGKNLNDDLSLSYFEDVKPFLPEHIIGLIDKIDKIVTDKIPQL